MRHAPGIAEGSQGAHKPESSSFEYGVNCQKTVQSNSDWIVQNKQFRVRHLGPSQSSTLRTSRPSIVLFERNWIGRYNGPLDSRLRLLSLAMLGRHLTLTCSTQHAAGTLP